MLAPHRVPRLIRRLLVLQAVALATLAVAEPHAAAGNVPPGPQLSVSIDDGRTTAAAGDRLTYTITVRNLGTGNLSGLDLTQSVPPGATVGATNPTGTTHAGAIRWRLAVRASGTAEFHTTVTVRNTPADLLRLASVACVNTSGQTRPLVCATHSDELPAGAALAGRRAQAATTVSRHVTWYVGIGLGVLVVAGVAMALVASKRRRARKSAL